MTNYNCLSRMELKPGWREVMNIVGALILGFVFFLLVQYFNLFGIIELSSILNQMWFHIAVSILIGYGVARMTT